MCAHGAKADGVHDDGPAVQAALASCSEVVIPAEGCGTATAASSAAALFLVGPVVIPSDLGEDERALYRRLQELAVESELQ